MGECESTEKPIVAAVRQALDEHILVSASMSVSTQGGRFQVSFDERRNVTAMGQVSFFGEFLDLTGVFENWVRECPLVYTSGNAPDVRDVLGTWVLAILDGQHRYAHVARFRGDGVAPAILGMNRVVGDESLRRGLKVIAPAPDKNHSEEQREQQQRQLKQAEDWMEQSLFDSVKHALGVDWILDCDATIKLLYGHQSGAEIGYNPRKPGRPSHSVHTYWVANLRLVLLAEVQSGKSTSAAHSLPGLKKLLLKLPREQRPRLVRGDCAFGNERVMCDLEEIDQAHLFKLKQSKNVKRLIKQLGLQTEWVNVGQGWEAHEDTLRLVGWSKSRRVIVMRRQVKQEISDKKSKNARTKSSTTPPKGKESQQLSLALFGGSDPAKVYEYAVLVTNTAYPIDAIGQLYRDRADCENGFDEMKNQWGWGGFSTQDIERCNLSAQAVALVYNWWSWYVRLAHPMGRLEAITSRPLLLAAVGRMTEHSGQRHILISVTHAAVDQVKSFISNIRKGLQHIRETAPQLPEGSRWRALVCYIVGKILAIKPTSRPNATAPPVLVMQ